MEPWYQLQHLYDAGTWTLTEESAKKLGGAQENASVDALEKAGKDSSRKPRGTRELRRKSTKRGRERMQQKKNMQKKGPARNAATLAARKQPT